MGQAMACDRDGLCGVARLKRAGIGPGPGRRRLALLAHARAFLLPSRSEGFSLAILEVVA